MLCKVGCVLLLCVFLVEGATKKRRRKTIEEISENSLDALYDANPYVAVLFHDGSKISAKSLHDLELIHGASEEFGIIWRRIQLNSNVITGFAPSDMPAHPCHVVLYRNGDPIMFGGKPDRQTAVFQWLVTELYCHKDQPLDILMFQFEILLRSFRNFVIISEPVSLPDGLMMALSAKKDICSNLNNVLVVFSADEEVHDYLSLEEFPALTNIVHGIPIPFSGNLNKTEEVETWIGETLNDDILSVGERELDKILKRESEVMVLFMGSQEDSSKIHPQLNLSFSNFEVSYDLPTVRVKDPKVSKSYGLKRLPTILLFQDGKSLRFNEVPLSNSKVVTVLEEWIIEKLERKEKTVIKSISSTAFKNSPDEFRNVLLKEHTDSIRMLSKEYARLQKENQELRAIIKDIQGVLSADILSQTEAKSSGALTAECGDCISSVGQAVWTCGTLDVECIKNFVDVGSECYGCLCEILDSTWPNDAPNCFKKEIQAITTPPSSDPVESAKRIEL